MRFGCWGRSLESYDKNAASVGCLPAAEIYRQPYKRHRLTLNVVSLEKGMFSSGYTIADNDDANENLTSF